MSSERNVSRRNFLRLRPTDPRRTLELSLRELFLPGVSLEQALQDLARQLEGVDVLKLLEPEWLESIDDAHVVRAALAAFEAAGGRVEEQW